MIPVLPNPHDGLTPEQISRFSKFLTISNVLTPDECNKLVNEYTNRVEPAVKKHNYANPMSLQHCFLPCDHKIHQKLQSVWQRAIDHFNIRVSFVEPYKLQQYSVNDYFDTHIDNYHGLDFNEDRKLTLIVQLTPSSEYTGGSLYIAKHQMSREQGSAIIFPSFYPHRVEKVSSGVRWALVAWGWGPYWQ